MNLKELNAKLIERFGEHARGGGANITSRMIRRDAIPFISDLVGDKKVGMMKNVAGGTADWYIWLNKGIALSISKMSKNKATIIEYKG